MFSEIEHNGCRLFRDIPSGKNSGFKVRKVFYIIRNEKKKFKWLLDAIVSFMAISLVFARSTFCLVM